MPAGRAAGASADSGLSADFNAVVAPFQLNEDNGQDEVPGRIRFVDPRNNRAQIFFTPRSTAVSSSLLG
jgi:hypothetical protein